MNKIREIIFEYEANGKLMRVQIERSGEYTIITHYKYENGDFKELSRMCLPNDTWDYITQHKYVVR